MLGKCRKLHPAELSWVEIYTTHIHMCVHLRHPSPSVHQTYDEPDPSISGLQLTVQLQRPLLPGFTITHKHRPPAARFCEQTSGPCQNEVPYFRRTRAFLNHSACVKFCYRFYVRSLSFLARHWRSVWMLCPNPVFAISPVPVGTCTILPSMVILLECTCFVITELIVLINWWVPEGILQGVC